MKQTFFIFILIITTLSSLAQKEDRVWCFGGSAGIDFTNVTNPQAFQGFSRNSNASACIANNSGNLLLTISVDYSVFQRDFILDGNGNQIANGDNIFFVDSGNDGIFIPISDTMYYFFGIGIDTATAPYLLLYQNLIRKDINGFYISIKNSPLLDLPLETKISATKHANGKDWWIVVHQGQGLNVDTGCNNSYYVFELTSQGVQQMSKQEVGVPRCGQQGSYGEMTFSKSGKILASSILLKNMVELANFDRCNGVLYNVEQIISVGDSNSNVYGVEFSPDESKLYVVCSYDHSIIFPHSELYQFDLSATDIASSKVLLWSVSTSVNGRLGQLQLGPDGKVYVANNFQDGVHNKTLGVINHPNIAGLSCDYQPFGFQLTDTSTYSLPNNPNYVLDDVTSIWRTSAGKDTFICFHQGHPQDILIGGDSVPDVSATWVYEPGMTDIHKLQQIVRPTISTWYYVTLSDTSITGSCQSREDSVFVEVKICNGIDETVEQFVKVFPNPANDKLLIELEDYSKPIACKFYNAIGEEVLQVTLAQNRTSIDISSFPEGLYFYRLIENNSPQIGKVIITH